MAKFKLLRPEEDAFGQMLWAFYNGREALEIVERDDGYINAMSPKGYFSNFKEWSSIEQEAMQLVHGRVLDVGCGAGRHSLYLQAKGLDVLGIDVSPLAIETCQQRGLRKTKLLPAEDVDFKQGYFDTIIMMGNNFGLFGNFKKAKTLLKRLHKMTSKNALIIADTRDPYKTDNPAHLEYHQQNKKRGRMGGQVRIRVRFMKHIGRWFDYLMVSKEEMKEILEGTGWKIKRFSNSDGPQYLAILEKTTSRENLQ